jgi:exonuclease VII small subunit
MRIVMLAKKYGIEIEQVVNGHLEKVYIDLKTSAHKWRKGEAYFRDCWGTLECVKKTIAELQKDDGEITPYIEEETTAPPSETL